MLTRQTYCSSWRSTVAIWIAASAASAPLLPAFVPARSMACSIVSTVKMPKPIGISSFKLTCADAAARFAGHVVEMRRRAADDAAERDQRVVAAARGQLLDGERCLERARHANDLDVAGSDAVLQQRADGGVEQSIDDEVVEPRRDDAEAQAARVEVAFERLDAVIHAASSRSAASETYSTTSSPNPDNPCMCFGAPTTRMRRTPSARTICAPMPNVRKSMPR